MRITTRGAATVSRMTAPDLLTSPLHERHVGAGRQDGRLRRLGDADRVPRRWSRRASTPPFASAVGVFDVSHLGKASVTRPRRGGLRQRLPDQRPRADRPPARRSTRCAATTTGGVVDDLIAYLRVRRRRVPHPQRRQHRRGRTPAARPPRRRASRSPTCTSSTACSPCRARAATRCSQALGLPTGHDYMSFVEADWQGRPVIVCRTGYTGERGYELVAALGRRAGPVGRADSRPAAPYDGLPVRAGRARHACAPRWATRCTARTFSLDITPVQARAGWAVGWKKDAFWGRDALVAEKAAGARRTSWGLLATGRGIPRAHCQVKDAHGEPLGEVTSGTFSPTLKQGIALALLATGGRRGRRGRGRRAGPRGRCDRRPAAVRAGPDAARRARPLSRPLGPPAPAAPHGRRPGSAGGPRPRGSAGVRQDERGGRQGDREARSRPPPRGRRR